MVLLGGSPLGIISLWSVGTYYSFNIFRLDCPDPWFGFVMWCELSLFPFILVSVEPFILFPLRFLFSLSFSLFLSPLVVSPGLAPFLVSLPYTFLCRSPFVLPIYRLFVPLLLLITFLLLSYAPIFMSSFRELYLKFYQLVLPHWGRLVLMPPFAFVVVTVVAPQWLFFQMA